MLLLLRVVYVNLMLRVFAVFRSVEYIRVISAAVVDVPQPD